MAKESVFGKLANSFGFLKILGTHQKAQDKYEDDLIKASIQNQKDLIAPPKPERNSTTAFGDYFHSRGSVKIVSNIASMANYCKMDIDDYDHKNVIGRYRSVALMPEVDDALDEYVHSIIVHNENDEIVRIDFKDETLFTADLRERINEEFRYILKVLDFDSNAEMITRSFLIDGIFPVEKIFDENYIGRGIIDVNFLDPEYMTKVEEFDYDQYTQLRTLKDSYYIFSFPQFYGTSNMSYGYGTVNSPMYSAGRLYMNYKLQIPEFLVSVVDTGKYHPTRLYPVSILHRALKVANQLRLLEDAILIYRITRAPERRVFYVDVGNLPSSKAEEQIEELMRQYRTEKSYNTETGALNADADIMSMLEDFWLPRRNGTSSTEVTTLAGAQNLGEINDLDYFYKKLWRALGVPYNRRMGRESSQGGMHPHTTEIAADEIAFYKNVRFLRKRMEIGLFKDLLCTQLVTRGIINGDYAEDIMDNIKFQWNEDNNFAELIKFEIMNERFDMVSKAGYELTDFLSKPWIAKNLLHLTNEEIEDLKEEREHPERYGFGEIEEETEGGESEEFEGGFGGGGFGTSSNDFGSEPEIGMEDFGETETEGEEEEISDFDYLP